MPTNSGIFSANTARSNSLIAKNENKIIHYRELLGQVFEIFPISNEIFEIKIRSLCLPKKITCIGDAAFWQPNFDISLDIIFLGTKIDEQDKQKNRKLYGNLYLLFINAKNKQNLESLNDLNTIKGVKGIPFQFCNLKIINILYKSNKYFGCYYQSTENFLFPNSTFKFTNIKNGCMAFYPYDSVYSKDKYDLFTKMNKSICDEMLRRENNDTLQYECYSDFGIPEDKEKFLNPEGWGLTGIDTSIENNIYPNFPLGPDSLKSILDNFMKKETIWDISYHDNLNDSSGKSFNPFPFSESHNQHFIFQKGKIFIKHNGVLESIVGGENSLKKFNYQPKLKSLQPFKTRLI
ncbi:hypothetical protein M9Y10_032396 [Tritrichomonas musculus]|uniref:Uncharacterized protein n=1 Tax=Tritrichomonas musculus TaxID=1915356 RepID=A0ABR2GZY3_9EUKA